MARFGPCGLEFGPNSTRILRQQIHWLQINSQPYKFQKSSYANHHDRYSCSVLFPLWLRSLYYAYALTQTVTLLPHSTQTKSARFVDLTLSSIHKEIAPPPHPKFLGLYIESNHNIQVLNEAFHNIIIGGSKHQGLARAEDLQWFGYMLETPTWGWGYWEFRPIFKPFACNKKLIRAQRFSKGLPHDLWLKLLWRNRRRPSHLGIEVAQI